MENFSFSTIVNTLTERLKLQTLWSRPLFHTVYQILIETLSFGISKLAYLSYALGIEASWWNARQIKSIMPKTRALSYIPKRNQCPFGAVNVSPDSTFNTSYIYRGYSISIPKWSKLSDDNGNNISFVSEDYIYYRDYTGNLSINIKVGTPKTYRYVTTGSVDETFYITSSLIDNDEIEAYIIDDNDNILYTINILERDKLKFTTDLENYYCEIATLDDFSGIYIKFGDQVNTKTIPTGSNILIKYAETNGESDNITVSDVLTKFIDVLYDSLGNETTLYIDQSEAISDGSNSETLEEIKYNAPVSFDTAYNLNRLSDYETFLPANVSYIRKFIAWTNESIGGSMSGIDGQTIYGSAVSNDGSDLTESQKEDTLLTWIKPYKAPSEIFEWHSLQKIYLRLKSNVYLLSNYGITPSIIIQNINNLHYNTYNVLNVDFKQNVYNSDLCSLLQTISGIKRNSTELWYMETGLDYTEDNYQIKTLVSNIEETQTQKQILLKMNAIEILLKRKISGVWQNAEIVGLSVGNIIQGQNDYSITGSSIDYINGWVSFTIQDIANDVDHSIYGELITTDSDSISLGYQVSISYQTTDGDLKQDNDFRLSTFYYIGDVDVLYNNIETEFES